VLADLVGFQEERQVPFLYVTHNRAEALRLGGHALLLDQGRMVAKGNAFEVLSSPPSPEVAHVLGADNVFTRTLSAHHPAEGLSEIDLGGSFLYTVLTTLPEGASVALEALELRPGSEVFLLMKAVAVMVEPI
jgi:molybdate transport system ATP-binding protein